MRDRIECDVLIVGGGLVGSSLALALHRIPVNVVLVEARDPSHLEQPSFDGRVTALANGSQRILAQLELWPALQASAQPIRTIHIGQRGGFGAARIDAREEGVAALGFTIENRLLGEVLWRRLAAAGPGFKCLAPATLERFEAQADCVTATVDAGGRRHEVKARLLIAADGARSSVRRALGIAVREDDYDQTAIVLNCTTQVAADGGAFERFTPQGPLAVLPLAQGRVAVIWTLPPHAADAFMALPEAAFGAELERAFGRRLGRFERIGRRALHRLARTQSDAVTGPRALLIGNAAMSLHPVAGQGFNLALRDVATIAELIADEMALGAAADIGKSEVLDRYRAWRYADQRKVAGFTHGLVRAFGARLPGLAGLRGLGLVAFDLVPGAKALLARHTMGTAGRLPRLARGLDIAAKAAPTRPGTASARAAPTKTGKRKTTAKKRAAKAARSK
jgi:2-octaprenyl-6-methoxyphenol hydroxylase